MRGPRVPSEGAFSLVANFRACLTWNEDERGNNFNFNGGCGGACRPGDCLFRVGEEATILARSNAQEQTTEVCLNQLPMTRAAAVRPRSQIAYFFVLQT